jgi:hypothetical protein
MLDWNANVNPEFAQSNKTRPRPVKTLDEMESEGVVIQNLSTSDPLVMLKHFGPGNPDAQSLMRS